MPLRVDRADSSRSAADVSGFSPVAVIAVLMVAIASRMASALQQCRDLGVDEGAVCGNGDGISGTVSVDRGNRMEFGRLCVDEAADLGLIVAHVEVTIGLPRHQQHPRLDGGQPAADVAAEFEALADIATLPDPDLRQKIVGVTPREGIVPGACEVVFQRMEAGLAPYHPPRKGA